MKKVQISKEQLIDEINERLRKWNGDYKALADGAHINYHAARRAIMHGLKNNTKLLSNLCTFFGIEMERVEEVQNDTFETLTSILRETWDGTEPHAELLQSLIKSTKPFKVQERVN